jgi:hypothetical protein
MDKLVRRVTIVRGSGDNRRSEVLYECEHEQEAEKPNLAPLERSIRHMLKAQVIATQEAYQRHITSAEKGGISWMTDAPGNLMKATRSAVREMRKSVPFKASTPDDEDQGHGD